MSTLDALPSEIRLNIFGEVFSLAQSDESYSSSSLIAALRPCPNIYDEALSAFYKIITLHITRQNVCLFLALSESTTRKIHNLSYDIRLEEPVYKPSKWEETSPVKTFLTCRRASNLRHLNVTFRCRFINPDDEQWDFITSLPTREQMMAARSRVPSLEYIELLKSRALEAQRSFNQLSAVLLEAVMPTFFGSIKTLTVFPIFTGYIYFPDCLLAELIPKLGPAKLAEVGSWDTFERHDRWYWDFTQGVFVESGSVDENNSEILDE